MGKSRWASPVAEASVFCLWPRRRSVPIQPPRRTPPPQPWRVATRYSEPSPLLHDRRKSAGCNSSRRLLCWPLSDGPLARYPAFSCRCTSRPARGRSASSTSIAWRRDHLLERGHSDRILTLLAPPSLLATGTTTAIAFTTTTSSCCHAVAMDSEHDPVVGPAPAQPHAADLPGRHPRPSAHRRTGTRRPDGLRDRYPPPANGRSACHSVHRGIGSAPGAREGCDERVSHWGCPFAAPRRPSAEPHSPA